MTCCGVVAVPARLTALQIHFVKVIAIGWAHRLTMLAWAGKTVSFSTSFPALLPVEPLHDVVVLMFSQEKRSEWFFTFVLVTSSLICH